MEVTMATVAVVVNLKENNNEHISLLRMKDDVIKEIQSNHNCVLGSRWSPIKTIDRRGKEWNMNPKYYNLPLSLSSTTRNVGYFI